MLRLKLFTNQLSQLRKFSSSRESVLPSAERIKGTLVDQMCLQFPKTEREQFASLWNKERATSEIPFQNTTSDAKQLHPILGEKIADLGYKLIYKTNVHSLAQAPVWKQRITLRCHRAAVIANKLEKSIDPSINGVITFYRDKETGNVGIIDGQHRAGALLLLAYQGGWCEWERNVLVEVFDTTNETAIEALFREINSAVSLRAEGLNDSKKEKKTAPLATYSEILRQKQEQAETNARRVRIVNETTSKLMQKYPSMFRKSVRCKNPHVNLNLLRDEIHEHDVMHRHGLISTVDLLRHLDDANERIRVIAEERHAEEIAKSTNDVARHNTGGAAASWTKAMKDGFPKAYRYGFFLGWDKSWLKSK